MLPEYKASPQITRERLYLETMEHVLENSRKVLIDDKSNNLMVLPLDQLMRGGKSGTTTTPSTDMDSASPAPSVTKPSSNVDLSGDSVMDQRRANAQRNDTNRQGGE